MYQKILDARAELLLNKTNCFFDVLVAVAVIVAQNPGPSPTRRANRRLSLHFYCSVGVFICNLRSFHSRLLGETERRVES